MHLYQIFAALEKLQYDSFCISGNPLGTKLKCELRKPGQKPIVAYGVTAKHSLQNALKLAWRRTDS